MLAERDCNAQGILGCVVRWVDQGVVGAMVDSVSDVLELSKALIKSAPEMNTGTEASYITGIASDG